MSKARYLREVGEMAAKITEETVEFMVDYKLKNRLKGYLMHLLPVAALSVLNVPFTEGK